MLALCAVAACGEESGPLAPPSDVAGSAGAGAVAGTVAQGGAAGVAGTAAAGGAGMSSAGAGAGPAGGTGGSAGASGGGAGGSVSTTGGGGSAAGGGGGLGSDGGAGAASGGVAGAAGGGPMIPPGCELSSPVSFKQDVLPFLTSSCGKAKGGGCHVTDGASTMGSLCPDGSKTCGFNHAYDWITAGSHNEFCKQTPGPIRFTVVVDVIKRPKPASCTASRVMPPDGPPPTACQLAALEAWLAEPRVRQMHRADDTSPAEPYLMPPFN